MNGEIIVAGFGFTREEWKSVGDELWELVPDEATPIAFPYAAYEISFVEADAV